MLRPEVFAEDTIYYRNADIDQVILPRLGSWQVDKITSIDVVTVLKESDRTWLMGKRLLTSFSKVLDHACGPTVIAANPWFRELMALAGDSKYFLPARHADRTKALGDMPVGRTTLWTAFNRAFSCGDIDIRRFTPHDTRSTAKGHLRNLGVSREISEIALNHTLKDMEGVYDVREEITERRSALKLWADYLVSCESGEPPKTSGTSNVVPLRKAA